MTSAVAELEAGLQAMLQLKPPGVSGSKIQSLTALCLANIQSESVLIQKLYTHFKKAPGSHKLGVLYVVDSVTRKWAENAKAEGQIINSSAQDGTYAAGVHKVTELLPVLMNDISQSAPDDQKDKIKKLVDIWEKGQTFPMTMLTSFKEKLYAPPLKSTTPDGSPPRDIPMLGLPQQGVPVAAPSNTTSILAALANMAKQNTAAPQTLQGFPVQANVQNSHPQSNSAQYIGSMNPTYPFPTSTQPPVNVQAPAAVFQGHGQSNSAQSFLSNPPFGAPAPPLGQVSVNTNLQQQILVLKALADQGIPQEQWGTIIAALNSPQGNGVSGMLPQAPPQLPGQNQNQNQNGWQVPRADESRDHNGYNEPVRSPPGRYRRRSRSPSPARGWSARDSPNSHRRDDVGYDEYRGGGSPGRRADGRGRGANDYRQRSPPPRRGRSPSPDRRHDNGQPGGDKWIEYDASIGKGNIKVLSRTLFVGGVTGSEQDLRGIFNNFGIVQTCIVNKDKRHAFVKMVSRKDAVSAKEAMESNRTPDSQLRTRWGVGFGPRDCSDYQTGISIIPINKLTDADRKWMLTAEYGGSGGKPIEGGMVVEEPDIEIGQGVSSKAISRRMQTDKGGNNGPKSSREREDEERQRQRRPDRRDEKGDSRERDGQHSTAPPPVPGFPYNSMPTLPNGMPMFPPGFQFPGHTGPPGHRS